MFAGFLIACCVWTCFDSTDRLHSAHRSRWICTHALQFLFSFSLEISREWEGKEIIVLSVLAANCTVWVRQYTWSWKHSYSCVTRCKTSPKAVLCCQQTPLRKLTDRAKATKLFSSLIRAVFYHLNNFFFLCGEGSIFGLSFDIMYTFLLPDAPLWFAVCVLPFAMWLNGLLSSSAASPLHQHTNI